MSIAERNCTRELPQGAPWNCPRELLQGAPWNCPRELLQGAPWNCTRELLQGAPWNCTRELSQGSALGNCPRELPQGTALGTVSVAIPVRVWENSKHLSVSVVTVNASQAGISANNWQINTSTGILVILNYWRTWWI